MSASFILVSSLLLMSPDASQVENETNAGKWSVGAGVSSSATSLNIPNAKVPIGSSLGYLSGVYAPSYGLSIEYYTSQRLAWMLKVSGNYKSTQNSAGYGSLGEGKSQSMSLSLSGGPRWIFNPEQRVEVSSFAVLSASYHAGKTLTDPTPTGLGMTTTNMAETSETESTEEQEPTDALDLDKNWGWSLGLSLGIAFDMELMDDLYLRVFSTLASVSKTYAALRSHPAGEAAAPVVSRDSFGIQFDFRPGVELRMVF